MSQGGLLIKSPRALFLSFVQLLTFEVLPALIPEATRIDRKFKKFREFFEFYNVSSCALCLPMLFDKPFQIQKTEPVPPVPQCRRAMV